ncbi:hypothetical protein FNU79_18190 [Deinococcus detaillensis]|uniref:Uncharacterized protein n=1 Tax=Deinococcus detaillensis TaxID=2592048 RepID=A0A553UGD5_9DEIO|nr:hypothetical protein FNU79_18190 [Deinococcus detaillensis]
MQSQAPIKRQVVGFIRQQFKLTELRACRVLRFWRSTQRLYRNGSGEEKDLALGLALISA